VSWLHSVIRARRGYADQPRFLTYLVTFRCNARCVMCDSWRKAPVQELSLPAIEQIFRQLPRLDAVRLSGGEPFLRRDLREIADLATEHLRPRLLHITSNGFLTEQIVRFCETRNRALPLMLLLSLDGVGEKHDTVRGIPGAWEKAMRTLHALTTRRKELNLRLAVNQTIVDAEGCAQYRALREVLTPLAVPHHVVIAYDQSATYSTTETSEMAPHLAGAFPTFGELPPEQLQALFADFAADVNRYAPLERLAKHYYYRGIRNRLFHHRDIPNPPCVALSSHLRLYPNGDVPVCQFNSTRLGNLAEQPFAELWHSERARTLRAWIARCPGCWAECEVLPNAIYSGDILREVPAMLLGGGMKEY